jgi:hypothetical protein
MCYMARLATTELTICLRLGFARVLRLMEAMTFDNEVFSLGMRTSSGAKAEPGKRFRVSSPRLQPTVLAPL